MSAEAVPLVKPTRPLLRWHGGKFRMADWITGLMPTHEAYVEPFGGAASVLLSKNPIPIEVYNDLDGCVWNLFKVLQNPAKADLLRRMVELTPFSRQAFVESWHDVGSDPFGIFPDSGGVPEEYGAWQVGGTDVEEAHKLIVRSFQAIGAKSSLKRNGWRTRTAKAQWSPCVAWNGWPDEIPNYVGRLKDTIIEREDWRRMFDVYDHPTALFYLDPPYVHETRAVDHKHVYEHELSDADHDELLERAKAAKGMVMLSGYDTPKYWDALVGWTHYEKSARAQTNVPRTEHLWLSPNAMEKLQMTLF